MSPDEFRSRLLAQRRPTRELIVTPGDPGCEPVTKISGMPWWPAGLARPTCGSGHAMSFMAQFRLADIPGFESLGDRLASFHYCQQCSYDGKMSHGWDCPLNTSGYDVSVIADVNGKRADGRGIIAEVVIEPHAVRFRDVLEVPGYEDTTHSFDDRDIPDDYPGGEDDFDENIYPGLIHVERSKVGGWPSWVQDPFPPETGDCEQLHFLGQLDWMLCHRATWCEGGHAYLFLISSEDGPLRGEMVLQTT